MEPIKELDEHLQAIAKWLKKNKNPYYSIVINSERAQLISSEQGTPIETD